MTASAATVKGLSRLGLVEREPNQVEQTRPAGQAEEQAGRTRPTLGLLAG